VNTNESHVTTVLFNDKDCL